MSDPSSLPSGWFPDPLGRYDHRYFNGTAWTSDVSSNGQRYVDPEGVAPSGSRHNGSMRSGSSSRTNGAATAAVVMGSVGVAIAWIPFIVVIGGVLAILALVFGIIGFRRSDELGAGRGASITGIVMGALGIAGAVVGVVLSVMVFRVVVDFVEPGDHDVEVTSCEVDGRRATVEGRITNLDDRPREYTVFVDVDDRTETAIVDAVDPGETASWSASVLTRSPISTCEPDVEVHGPFPYGIEVDPVGE